MLIFQVLGTNPDKSDLQSSTKAIADTPAPVPSPTADVGLNVSWVFHPVINVTVVRMAVTNLQSAQWAAVGLGIELSMVSSAEQKERRDKQKDDECTPLGSSTRVHVQTTR
jgi:hypothetical protein